MEIKLWNHLGEENSDIHLSVKELYLYFYVSSLKRQDNVSVTTIDMLQDYLPLPFVKTKKDNKNVIREGLDLLIGKELISITCNNVMVSKMIEVTNKCLLYISINGDFVKGKFKNYKGYESIEMDVVNAFEKVEYLYIYYVIAKYKNKCIMSYSRWSTKLGVSESKAKSLIKEMKKKEIIYSVIGDYSNDRVVSGQKLQDSNKYSLTPFTDEEKSNMQRKLESDGNTPEQSQDSENEVIDPFSYVNAENLSGEWDQSVGDAKNDNGNWYSDTNPITEDDIKLYVNSTNIKFRQHCESKMKQIRDRVAKKYNDKAKGDYVYSRLLNQVDEIKAKIKAEKQAEIDKENENRKINAIKNGQIVVVRNNEDVYIDSVNDIRVSDKLYRLQVIDDPFNGGQDDLKEFLIEDIIKEQSNNADFYHVYSDSVERQLLDKFKQVYADTPKSEYDTFDVYKVTQKMKEYRDEIILSINSQRQYDEAWEGDLISVDDGRNISLIGRIREVEKSKQVI